MKEILSILLLIKDKNMDITLVMLLMLLYFIHILILKNKYSKGACKGNTDFCRLKISVSQSYMVKARFDNLINKIHSDFIKDVTARAEQNNDITPIQLKTAISCHKHLLWYSFYPAIEETKRMLRENGIPSDPHLLDNYMTEKNSHINAIVWSRFEDGYCDEIMIMTLQERKDIQERMQTSYIQFARAIILTGSEIAKSKK